MLSTGSVPTDAGIYKMLGVFPIQLAQDRLLLSE
jgi:hypothetical protein